MKFTRSILILVVSMFALTSVAQKKSKKDVVINFGDEQITKEEFKRVYLKNNSGDVIAKSTVEEYLELYINFKLKVKEAEAMGMDTASQFVKELAGYRKQLAQPYLTAKGILEELKKEGYERLTQDIRASHILIAVDKEASPADTLIAYNKVLSIKKKLEKGAEFADMARTVSEDPSAKANAGDLGYFTAFYMVYPFESAAYNTEEGAISDIVRTQYGYHVLKVVDKREAVGNIKVAHILISSDPELSKTDDPEGKIREIYKRIKKGESFEELAAQFSDDTRTASKGGVLPMFGVGRMVPSFSEPAFALKNDGDISEPVQTQYGWHIIKRIQRVPIGSFEETEKELEMRIKKDSRSNLNQATVIKKIKKQYGYKQYDDKINEFIPLIDSSYFEANWSVDKAKALNKTIFTIGDRDVNQSEFADYLAVIQQKRKVISSEVIIHGKFQNFMREKLIEFKDSKLDEEYPDFKALMQEYHDGILLFNLTDQLVWSKAILDTVGLENFLEGNKENYKWEKRVDAVVYSAANEDIASQVKKMIKKGQDQREITEVINSDSQLNLQYESKKYQKGDHEVVDQLNWEEGISDNIAKNGRVVFVHMIEVIEPAYKTLDDSRGLITSDYQNYLEKQWVETLRKKYSFEVNKNVLKALKNELN